MSKTLKKLAKLTEKATKSNEPLKMFIPAGQAMPGPPLGPALGAKGINIAAFVKDFNEKTKHFQPGIPITSRISLNPDRTYKLILSNPPIDYFLRQAAGTPRGAMDAKSGEICGMITHKHVYHIAQIKAQDYEYDCVPLPRIAQDVVDECRKMGVKIVPHLDAEEYRQFLAERAKVVEKQMQELEEKRQAKLLRA